MKIKIITILFIIIPSFVFTAASFGDDERKVDYDVIIIGAGAGGLSSGATLARKGLKVAVFEQHDKVGGYMTSFERDDYTFEVSLHFMDAVREGSFYYEVLKELDVLRRVQFIELDIFYRSIFPDQTLDVPVDWKAYRDILYDKFPDEKKGITKYFRTMSAIDEELEAVLWLPRKSFFIRLYNYLAFPFKYSHIVKYRKATLNDILDDHIQDEKLRAMLAQLWGAVGLLPSRLSGIYYSIMWSSFHFKGAYYIKGTSQSLSNAMASVILENSGQVFLSTRIDKILIEDSKAVGVRDQNGKDYRSRFVISNASALQTYLNLIGEEHLEPNFVDKLKNMELSCSVINVFLGLDLDLRNSELKQLHEIIIHDSYDLESEFPDAKDELTDIPSFSITLYSNTDPGLAPDGKSVVTLLAIVPYEYKNNWSRNVNYEEYVKIKEEVAWKLIKKAERVIPGISDSIEVMEVATPRTFERYTLHEKGALYGFSHTPEQSHIYRVKQKSPIKNLYLAGGWTFPGEGQSTCIMSGYLTAQMILNKM